MKTWHQTVWRSTGILLPLLLLALLFALLPLALASAAAYGGTLQAHSEQALLAGPAPGPCFGLGGPADYAGGMDAYGHEVTPAEGPYAPPPVQISHQTVMASRGHTYMPVEVQGLNRGLAASDACSHLRAEERQRAAARRRPRASPDRQ